MLCFAPKCSVLLDTKVYYTLPQSVAYYAILYLKAYYTMLYPPPQSVAYCALGWSIVDFWTPKCTTLYPSVYYTLPESIVCFALPFTPKCSGLLDTKAYYALPQSVVCYALPQSVADFWTPKHTMLYLKAYYAMLYPKV